MERFSMNHFDELFSALDDVRSNSDFAQQTLKASTQAMLQHHRHRLWGRRAVLVLVAMSIGVGAFHVGRWSHTMSSTIARSKPVTVIQVAESRRRNVMSLLEDKDGFWSQKLAQATMPAPYIRPTPSSCMSWWERLAQYKTLRDTGAPL